VKSELHFRGERFIIIKLLIFLLLSITFLFADINLKYSNEIRKKFSHVIQPIYSLAALPIDIYNSISTYVIYKNNLILEKKELEKKILIQSGIIQKIPSLQEENKRLKKLLYSSNTSSSSKIQMAELIKVNLNPFHNKIIINEGANKNIFIGQTVIDSVGVLGQVSEINNDFSVVTLITDPAHALLGVNARTNKRIIISGIGDNRKLIAKYIPLNEDIQEGDIIITSGLDNVFPEGYLIGQISKINRKESDDFLSVFVTPSSSLSSNREVMLLW